MNQAASDHHTPRWRQQAALYLNLIRWNRPAGWLLLLWPSLSALWLAAGGFPGWHLLLVFVLGTVLMRSAGCCINDVADREFDKHVKRTANRPVTSGALTVRQALTAGAVLALCAFALVLTTNTVTVAWSFVALAVTLAYPYAKRFVAMPQAVLGVAFSFGIPMAFAAVNGGPLTVSGVWNAVPPLAWGLLVLNVFWVLAYDDDLRIGMKTSAITLGKYDVAAVMGFYVVYLLGMLLLLKPLNLGWPQWFSIEIAAVQAFWHFGMIYKRQREGCFRSFRMNHWLGATVFAGIAGGLWLKG
jgi:4-hydroxybenzoate polyprenyltransferase